MEREVSGHRLGPIRYEIDGFRVYRAERTTDRKAFLVKAPARDFPPVADVQRLERELRVLQRYESHPLEILKPVCRLDDNRNSYVLYEHFEGIPVEAAGMDTRELTEFHAFARALMVALERCHRSG